MDALTPQEAAVLELISRNPFVGQQDIADALGIARSTVAAHVVQLMRRGHILGRGYILPEAGHIVCLGGAVIERKHLLQADLAMGTVNGAARRAAHAGYARNIAETLALLGLAPSFVTAVGDDAGGSALIEHLRGRGVDTARVIVGAGQETAEHVALISPAGEMLTAVADMSVFDLLTADALAGIWPQLAGASWVVADTNLMADAMAALAARQGGGRYNLALVLVSPYHTPKIPADLAGVDLLFAGLAQGAAYLGCPLPQDHAAARQMARDLQAKGAAQVVVMGPQDRLYLCGGEHELDLPLNLPVITDRAGSYEALVAGTISALREGQALPEAVAVGAALAGLVAETAGAIRPDLTRGLLDAALARKV